MMVANQTTAMVPAGASQVEAFGSTELARVAETASTAVAARAKAEIESRYIMALQRPRDMDGVRSRLLKECKRPSFARVARYHKPIGNGIEGPSIRFAEAAIRCMGNITPETAVVYDDAEKRIIRVSVTDLEANVPYSQDVTIDKVVERSTVRGGQTVIGQRTNSRGQRTYLVAATEDDLLNKQGALISKALRTMALRLLPGDLLDECMTTVVATLKSDTAQDPDAERKRLLDCFDALHVPVAEIKEVLGHDLGTASPAELTRLRGIYVGIRDGNTTWAEVMEAARAERSPTGEAPKKGAAAARAAVKAAAEKSRTIPDPDEGDGPPPDDSPRAPGQEG
jgi:hypothetical protein